MKKLADRRWRYVAIIPIVVGVIIILVGSFAQEVGSPLPFPASGVGGGVIGLGIGLFMASRAAAKSNEPPSSN